MFESTRVGWTGISVPRLSEPLNLGNPRGGKRANQDLAGRLRLFRPPGFSDQRDEPHRPELLVVEAIVFTTDRSDEVLRMDVGSDRNHESAANLELFEQRGRNPRPACGDDDRVKRGFLGPAEGSVAMADLDIVVSETLEPPGGGFREFTVAFDGINILDEPRHDRRCISRPRADFENALAWLEFERLGHPRHNEGLRNRLPQADPEWGIAVGELAEVLGDKLLARDASHRVEHGFVANSELAKFVVNEVFSLSCKVQCRLHEPYQLAVPPLQGVGRLAVPCRSSPSSGATLSMILS